MRRILPVLSCCLICVASPQSAQVPTAAASTPVPALVRFEGSATGADGKPLGEAVAIAFRIYRDEQSGEPLWSETQNVALDPDGHYLAQLGAASPSGIPMELFATGEARWLEVEIAGLPAQKRVLLSSVPYAIRAADADSLAGRHAADFVTQDQLNAQLASTAQSLAVANGVHADQSLTGSGTANTVPLWTTSTNLGDSILTQTGSKIGVNEATPLTTLDINGTTTMRGWLAMPAQAVATATQGVDSPYISMTGSSFKAGGAAVAQRFGFEVQPQANNTANPSATLGLLYSSGTAGLADTGLLFNPSGKITFAPGQTFPGTIAGVTATSPITGGGTSGTVSVGLDSAALEATLNSAYAQLGAANTFAQTQTMNQGLTVAGTASANLVNSTTGYQLGGALFESGNSASQNASLGFSFSSAQAGANNVGVGPSALAANSTGSDNTAVGTAALTLNQGGDDNTAVGYLAMNRNQGGTLNTAVGVSSLFSLNSNGEFANSGQGNTAVGDSALYNNGNGGENTALGYQAGPSVQQADSFYNTYIGYVAGTTVASGLVSATAIGSGAIVNQSRALVLGGNAGITAVNVGIGTATPFGDYGLDVEAVVTPNINSGIVVNAGGGNLYLGMTNGAHKFRVGTSGEVWADGGYQSSGADFAESVAVRGLRSEYEPGDLMAIDPGGKRRLALARTPYSTLVAGIYSTKPGMLATPHDIDDTRPSTSEVPLAVVGIVPCKVTAENGPIRVGDLLVTSSRPGYAMKGTDRKRLVGAVVGKALEPLAKGTGAIQVLVTLQ
jgi:hypothetical protein